MKVFAISDLHLTSTVNKPMEVFGGNWTDYWNRIQTDWKEKVGEDDAVLIAGDISWAMTLSQAVPDMEAIAALPGKKIIIRGNHDYWWSGYGKITAVAPPTVTFIQNNAVKCGPYVFCGTRGWSVPEGDVQTDEDKKIFEREKIRLRMSLEAAKNIATEGEEIIVMMHYPPFNSRFADSPFTDIISEYDIKTVIYGHLHGNKARFKDVVNKGCTEYLLTSCDFLNHTLLTIR